MCCVCCVCGVLCYGVVCGVVCCVWCFAVCGVLLCVWCVVCVAKPQRVGTVGVGGGASCLVNLSRSVTCHLTWVSPATSCQLGDTVRGAMEELSFSEEDIRSQLAALGYHNVSQGRLREFQQDLQQLIQHERSRSGSSSASVNGHNPSLPSRGAILPAHERAWLEPDSRRPRVSRSEVRDPYIRHTTHVPRGSSPTAGLSQLHAPRKPQLPAYEGDPQIPATNHSSPEEPSFVDSRRPVSATEFRKPAIKRKVLRRHNGEVQVFDESTATESDAETTSEFEFRQPPISLESDSASQSEESERAGGARGRREFQTRPPPSRWTWRSASEDRASVQDHPPSFIRPQMNHPHTRNLKKTDPVAKYLQYKQEWENFKPPGECNRKNLRWNIREHMLYKEEPLPRPQRVFAPNTYVVPTEKKRSALRWEVRHDMARGNAPQSFYCPL
ncbi:centriolar and ciliogenesis-associated protein HYLS1 isoform X1 [Lampetra planeri]